MLFNKPFDPHVGPCVEVSFSSEPTMHMWSMPRYTALLDTGASVTCISEKIANQLDLVPKGKRQVIGATGTALTNIYDLEIMLWSDGSGWGCPIEAALFSGTSTVEVLIGRDILCRGLFVLDNSGRFSFAI